MQETATARFKPRVPTNTDVSLKSRIKYYFTASYGVYSNLFGPQRRESGVFDASVASVLAMAKVNDLKLIWVNDRWEVNGPTSKSQELLNKLGGLDITRCRIPADGFLPRDDHPNAGGYDALVACVEKVVRHW